MKLDMKGLTQTMVSEFMVTNIAPLSVKGNAKVDRMLFGLGGKGLGVPQYVVVQFETEIPK